MRLKETMARISLAGAFLIATLLIPSLVVTAQTQIINTTARDRQSINITVYNSDIGLVRETRNVNLPAGRFSLKFGDVAAQIMPETVYFGSKANPGALKLLEQNYQYDLLNPQKLLDKFVGREVTLVLSEYSNNTTIKTPTPATLLSNNGGQVWRIGSNIVINPTNISEIRFPDLPQNLVATPTLMIDVQNGMSGTSGTSGAQTIETSYLSQGLNWKADYVLAINAEDTRGSLQGWVTLTNKSGAGFEDARLQLVAGDVNRVARELATAYANEDFRRSSAGQVPQFKEQSFFEYHLYTLERPTSIHDQETKQVSLLEASGFNLIKEYVINGQKYYYRDYNQIGQPVKEKVGVYVQFKNSQENKLGVPLPAGTVRLYKADDVGGQQFIGEDHIDHTPKNEEVRVKVGDAFDVVAERKQTDYKVIALTLYE
ncbi:MAG: DUF4139 domain-containing protein, partial [Pyrinomonadaceae bacterium]